MNYIETIGGKTYEFNEYGFPVAKIENYEPAKVNDTITEGANIQRGFFVGTDKKILPTDKERVMDIVEKIKKQKSLF